VKSDELTFARATQIAMETEDAARVAKETVFGTKPKLLHKVGRFRKLPGKSTSKDAEKHEMPVCYRCGKKGHLSKDCRFKNAICNFFKRKGHLQSVCRKKKQLESEVKYAAIKSISDEATAAVPKLEIPVKINDLTCTLELDTAAGGSFLFVSMWEQLGRPELRQPGFTYHSASSRSMPAQGCFMAKTLFPKSGQTSDFTYMVTSIPGLELLGHSAIKQMGISLDRMLYPESIGHSPVRALTLKQDVPLQRACQQLCEQFPELFQSEMGCLKDFELEVKFMPDAKPSFCKPRAVPIALQEDLSHAYDSGIAKGVWTPVTFNSWGTPVVPVGKASLSGETKAGIRVCGDYSVSVNSQLETHRHPLPKLISLTPAIKSSYARKLERGWLSVHTVVCCYKTFCRSEFHRHQVTSKALWIA